MATPDRDRLLWGIELRYVLTDLIAGPEGRTWQVRDLTRALTDAGFVFTSGRLSKTVSDALRTEVDRGRVVRMGWGRYTAGNIPGATRRRIRIRARAARVAASAAAARAAEADVAADVAVDVVRSAR